MVMYVAKDTMHKLVDCTCMYWYSLALKEFILKYINISCNLHLKQNNKYLIGEIEIIIFKNLNMCLF